ncbi:hypothetical protein [Gimesia fumaroli]|uniref:Thiol:disulfide interchange protein DsbD N-terminal domain-containing protein n=1 Tax=Gimesia fumaroli TaxID=2527976 RepID=A0A518IFE5_9PLAN|nr:hypothetical protein [Gimesia fumaroli]QDV51804.1 hypothetical protein Enr17x_38630 [Gimesia fumaroli]
MNINAPASDKQRSTLIVWLIVYAGLSLFGCEKSVEQKHDAVNSTPQDLTQTEITEIEQKPTELTHRIKGKPVSVTLRVPKSHVKPGETLDLSVLFEIAPLWEIRAFDALPADTATQLTLNLPTGFQAAKVWESPSPDRSLAPVGHPAYMGKPVFHRHIQVTSDAEPGKQEITCHVSYQACDEFRCLKPAEIKLKVTVQVEKENQ